MNDQTQHNHPPRCCCITASEQPAAVNPGRTIVCPMCIEHGELARLAEWTPEYPGQPEPQCPSCHTVAGHPHTDYCNLTPPLAGNIEVRTIPVVRADGITEPPIDDRISDVRVLCGFRSLDNIDLTCSYPPHPVDKPHSWQDGGDPRGWRHTIDPNKP